MTISKKIPTSRIRAEANSRRALTGKQDCKMQATILSKKIGELAGSVEIDVLGFAEASEFEGYALKHSRRPDPRILTRL
jgi:hypothetical protein